MVNNRELKLNKIHIRTKTRFLFLCRCVFKMITVSYIFLLGEYNILKNQPHASKLIATILRRWFVYSLDNYCRTLK